MRLDEAGCRGRVAAARVGRLGTVGEDVRPHLVPVTYAVHGDELYIAVDQKPKTTTALKRLRNIAAHEQVAVLVDEYDEDWTHLWWVRVDGTASVLPEHPAAIELLTAKYPQYETAPPGGPVIVIQVSKWSGWAFA
ncbi:TIGR03668 family PPOX class F420-dependent oxidoreductase [Kribbella sp. NPDC048915]|uniref:TIGR03668 family PPOX class F420-dependent oxidoreductase n=1 Tax=Kribbella sp. NPDC048915 TaxID=3155148 RepID=UPI0033E11730